MHILILDTYYPDFLKDHYAQKPSLSQESFKNQTTALLERVFGTSDFYSRHLNAMGHQTEDLVVNCAPLQAAWAKANHVKISSIALKVPARLFRLPVVGRMLSFIPRLADIAVEQIKQARPDVLYCQDLWFLSPQDLVALRPYVRLIVGQIASPLPPQSYLKGFDLITTSFPHFVPRLKSMGIASEYFRIGFDTRVLDLIGSVVKDVDVSFVGGISRHHGNALPLLEFLAQNTPIEFFGYGAANLDSNSAIKAKHHGEVWGLNMYRALARSRITLNRHINVAENNANNMRLYEATGVGTLLLTDRKDNLSELFEPDKEVAVYSSPEEAAEKIRYYLAHPEEAEAIAKAGQVRTLRDHTYKQRMEELVPMLELHLNQHHRRKDN